jgi:SagB-type dehydrogenase family enzyme
VIQPEPDPLSAEFHVASRNLGAYKGMFKAHEVHYEPFVQRLVTTAPLHLDGYPRIALPPPVPVRMPVEDAIRGRASGRAFGDRPLSAAELGTLLRFANGVQQTRTIGAEPVFYRRPAPNSGDLGSVEIFPIALNVDGVPAGIYHFDTVHHDLARLYGGEFRSWLREVVLYQLELAEAAVAFVLTAAVGRLQAKYGLRGYRFALLDVGHVSENLYLVGTGLGLQICATAGFVDDELDARLGLDGLDVASMLVVLAGTTRRPR